MPSAGSVEGSVYVRAAGCEPGAGTRNKGTTGLPDDLLGT